MYSLTAEDVKKLQARESARHGGNIPADSDAAGLQSILAKAEKEKADLIAERQANLPLPDDPPAASDFDSADGRKTNVGSGGVSGSISRGNDALRRPAMGDSAARVDGNELRTNVEGQGVEREGADNLGGLPNDAVARRWASSTTATSTSTPNCGTRLTNSRPATRRR